MGHKLSPRCRFSLFKKVKNGRGWGPGYVAIFNEGQLVQIVHKTT